MKVKDIMRNIHTACSDLKVKEAVKIMSKKKIGSLLISENKKSLGIITERDILKNIDSLNKKVSDVMTKKIITIDIGKTMEEASRLMASKKIKRLPVVDEGYIVGIVTATDVLANSDIWEQEWIF